MHKITILGYQVSHSLNGVRYVDMKKEMCAQITVSKLDRYRKHLAEYWQKKFPHQGMVDIYFIKAPSPFRKVSYSELFKEKQVVSLSEN